MIETKLSPDATRWYERHLARESELHELILDSAYGGKAALSGGVASVKIAATTGAGVAVALAGTVLGGAIIYAGVNSGSSSGGDAVRLGLLVAAASIATGVDIAKKGYRESTHELKQDLDPSINYRFVRYLPEYLWMGWSDEKIVYPVQMLTPTTSVILHQPGVIGQTSVTVTHFPDVVSPHALRQFRY